jgi:hypothetical protein
VNWNPVDEGHEAAAGEWSVGDRVKARANTINVRTGSPGTVTGFSTVGGHPLVDFAGSGLALIRAPNRPRSSATTRLSGTPRAPAVTAAPLPPPPDWFDRPPRLQVSNGQASPTELSDENLAP